MPTSPTALRSSAGTESNVSDEAAKLVLEITRLNTQIQGLADQRKPTKETLDKIRVLAYEIDTKLANLPLHLK